MYALLTNCLDFIFPPSESALRVRRITSTTMSRYYKYTCKDGTHLLSTYTDTDIRALIHEAKFHGNKKAFLLLHTLFETFIHQTMQQIEVIMPIPLSPARLRARGYNQVYEVLRAGEIPHHIHIETEVLTRIRNTRPQTELARSERLTNMHDAFGVVHGEKIKNKHILLVDDVMTTGTTLKTAKATLQKYNPASITCLALAH